MKKEDNLNTGELCRTWFYPEAASYQLKESPCPTCNTDMD
jgi:hypothetical protein